MTSPTADADQAPILRVSADAMDEVHEVEDHTCDTGDFDRTICPEPCGYMHSYCARCGVRQDPCAHDTTTSPNGQTNIESTP